MSANSSKFSRRSFVAGSVLTAAGVAAAAQMPTPAKADEPAVPSASWLGEEPEVGEPVQTVEADVVVVGAGTGGWFAACSAAEEGVKVVLLEKTEGGANVRGDLGAVNSRYQLEDGCAIDEQGILFDLYRFSNGNSSYALHRTWYQNSGATVDWYGDRLAEHGVELWHELATENDERKPLVAHWPVGHSPAFPKDENGMDALSGKDVLEPYFTGLGGEVLYNTAMVKLAMDGDRVSGVWAANAEGETVLVNAAKGVIVATGGYGKNTAMLEALQPETLGYYSLNIARPGCTGDGIKACLWAGAAMDGTHSSMLFDRCALPVDALAGAATEGGMFFNMGSHPWLKVNLAGERFANEGSGVYDWMLHAGASQPDGTYCTIFDADWAVQAEQMDMHGCARMYPYENGAPANETVESIGGQIASLIEAGYIQEAQSFEELAQKLGLPVEAFCATVERYNELAVARLDEDFGKEAFRMIPLATPPFYGVRNTGVFLCTMDGIRIDTEARALCADGTPIEGLFVVGNDSGNYFDSSYPNTLTGGAAGRTITFGRIAGKAAAAR